MSEHGVIPKAGTVRFQRVLPGSIESGWHTHLGILVDRVRGAEPAGLWSTNARMEAEYQARLSGPVM